MLRYFRLQQEILNRKWLEFGLSPLIGYPIMLFLIVLAGIYLYTKTTLAAYILISILIYYQFIIHGKEKNEFLLLHFGLFNMLKIRFFENQITSLPIHLILLIHQDFWEALFLIFLSTIQIFIPTYEVRGKALPSLFSRNPYEFLTGTRKTWYALLFIYFIAFISIYYHNLNLGLFTLFLLFLLGISFYQSPENEFYIWIYSKKPSSFLIYKMKIALYHSCMITIPLILALLFMYPYEFVWVGITFLFSAFIYILFILVKYAAYPNEIQIPEAILIAMGISFPPLLFFLIPYFFKKSIQKLNSLLHD
jgi:hypothetical protein